MNEANVGGKGEVEVRDWHNRGAEQAYEEAGNSKIGPDEDMDVLNYWREIFAYEHPELNVLLIQRERCVAARAQGYLGKWEEIRLKRASEWRSQHEQPR